MMSDHGTRPSIHRFSAVFAVDGSASTPRKRAMYAVQSLRHGGLVRRLGPAGNVQGLYAELAQATPEEPCLVLVDVPFGLPASFPEVYEPYGTFLGWLDACYRRYGRAWSALVATPPASQSPAQPFYAQAKAGDKRRGRFDKRLCDRLTGAESVYWCTGAKQVGKAALQFWFEVLLPLREAQPGVAVWPFEPTENARIVIAECYPASILASVWGRSVVKSQPEDVVEAVASRRAELASLAADERLLLHAVSCDDEFDMFSMALAVRRWLTQSVDFLHAPDNDSVRRIEGWIVGVTATSNDQWRGPSTNDC